MKGFVKIKLSILNESMIYIKIETKTFEILHENISLSRN